MKRREFIGAGAVLLAGAASSQARGGNAQLLRSQIAEALGDKDDAIAFAKTFLATFDMGPPQLANPMREEARARITRLGGQFDEPRAAPVRVR